MNGIFSASGTPIVTSGNSAVLDLVTGGAFNQPHYPSTLSVLLKATGVTGTSPSLTAEVQWSNDGTNFASATTADAFAALLADGTALKQFTAKGRYARLKYTVTGAGAHFPLDASGYAA